MCVPQYLQTLRDGVVRGRVHRSLLRGERIKRDAECPREFSDDAKTWGLSSSVHDVHDVIDRIVGHSTAPFGFSQRCTIPSTWTRAAYDVTLGRGAVPRRQVELEGLYGELAISPVVVHTRTKSIRIDQFWS
jgi:hypothetical protein